MLSDSSITFAMLYFCRSDDDRNNGLWDEQYHEHKDTKPYGPMAIAMDFTFHGATHIHGLPSHADNFSLRSTA